jgi:thiamine pyrophosphokinase
MKKVYVITYPTPLEVHKIVKIHEDDFVIGVDQAVFYMYKQRIKVDLAVGDFDSLRHKSLLFGLNCDVLPSHKDQTDTYHALTKAFEISDDVTLIGGSYGDRIEHFYVHMMLPYHFPNLIIRTELSTIRCISQTTTLSHQGYVNIFPYPEATISLDGFEYALDTYTFKPFDVLGISNRIIETKGTLTIHDGRILLIETVEKEDNKKSA